MKRSHRIALLILGVATIAGVQTATADVRVHIGGSAHVRIGGGPVRARWIHRRVHHRPHRPHIRIHGGIWVGRVYQPGPFAQPPPPPAVAPCNCESPTYYPPIAPAPQAYPVQATYVAAPAERPLPRLGLGAFVGGVDVAGEHEGEDVGLVASLRLTRGLHVEGEIAENELADGARVDRRVMLGLKYELAPRKKLSPYLAGAIGGTQVEVGDRWEDHQRLAEIGGGLRLKLGDRFALFGDLRWGNRELVEQDGLEPDPRPAPGTDDSPQARVLPADQENYARGRVGLMMMF